MLSAERRRALKQRLAGRQPVFGGWTSIGHPSITEILCGARVDFIGIDLEHSTISQEQSQRIIAASQAVGVACLPRVASHNKEMIARLLDSGADGIIVPMVPDGDTAARIGSWCRYPPDGMRSFGVARAHGYGGGFDDYTKNWNDSFIFIAQIETQEAVANVDRILEEGVVDGVMIGPYDLSGSLGVPGQFNSPAVIDACRRVIDACREKEVACGTHLTEPTPELVAEALDNGYSFVVLASDVFILDSWSRAATEIVSSYRE